MIDPITFIEGKLVNTDNIIGYRSNEEYLYLIVEYSSLDKEVFRFGSQEELASTISKLNKRLVK